MADFATPPASIWDIAALQNIQNSGEGWKALAAQEAAYNLDARRSLMDYQTRRELQAMADAARERALREEQAFRAGEGALERANKLAIGQATVKGYMDRLDASDRAKEEAQNRKDAATRIALAKKITPQLPGEDIDEYEARAAKIKQDEHDTEIDALRDSYYALDDRLGGISQKLQADKQAALQAAGELAVRTGAGLSPAQIKDLNRLKYKNFIDPTKNTLDSATLGAVEAAFQQGVDAASKTYTHPVDLAYQAQRLQKRISAIEEKDIPALIHDHRDMTRFYRDRGETGGVDNRPRTPGAVPDVRAFLSNKGYFDSPTTTPAPAAAAAATAPALPPELRSPQFEGVVPFARRKGGEAIGAVRGAVNTVVDPLSALAGNVRSNASTFVGGGNFVPMLSGVNNPISALTKYMTPPPREFTPDYMLDETPEWDPFSGIVPNSMGVTPTIPTVPPQRLPYTPMPPPVSPYSSPRTPEEQALINAYTFQPTRYR